MASFQQPKSFLTQILEALFGGTFRAGPGPQSQPTKEELARRNHDNHVLAGKVRDLEQQIEELQHTCADLERVAMCDPLTGLYNRRGGYRARSEGHTSPLVRGPRRYAATPRSVVPGLSPFRRGRGCHDCGGLILPWSVATVDLVQL